MTEEELVKYDLLLAENDHDLYSWVTGTAAAPSRICAADRPNCRGFAESTRLNSSRLDNIREFPRYC
jgi:hypothetical protein